MAGHAPWKTLKVLPPSSSGQRPCSAAGPGALLSYPYVCLTSCGRPRTRPGSWPRGRGRGGAEGSGAVGRRSAERPCQLVLAACFAGAGPLPVTYRPLRAAKALMKPSPPRSEIYIRGPACTACKQHHHTTFIHTPHLCLARDIAATHAVGPLRIQGRLLLQAGPHLVVNLLAVLVAWTGGAGWGRAGGSGQGLAYVKCQTSSGWSIHLPAADKNCAASRSEWRARRLVLRAVWARQTRQAGGAQRRGCSGASPGAPQLPRPLPCLFSSSWLRRFRGRVPQSSEQRFNKQRGSKSRTFAAQATSAMPLAAGGQAGVRAGGRARTPCQSRRGGQTRASAAGNQASGVVGTRLRAVGFGRSAPLRPVLPAAQHMPSTCPIAALFVL